MEPETKRYLFAKTVSTSEGYSYQAGRQYDLTAKQAAVFVKRNIAHVVENGAGGAIENAMLYDKRSSD